MIRLADDKADDGIVRLGSSDDSRKGVHKRFRSLLSAFYFIGCCSLVVGVYTIVVNSGKINAAAINSTSSFLGGAERYSTKGFQCPEYEKVFGKPASAISEIVFDEDLRADTIRKLANVVRIPTESHDGYPDPNEEPDFEGYAPFKKLLEQLAEDFPLVWSKLKVEYVNHYSLVITWEGSNESLKPAMFVSHLDVVPVDKNTKEEWLQDPYGGYFDGTYLWGRGAIDNKNNLIGILQAAEYTLQNEPDFKPQRTILITSGADEELFGTFGAGYINELLLKRYGKNGIYSIMDEGGTPVMLAGDVWIGAPGVGEKGYLNVQFDISTPGGHSSVSPDHTCIGIAAELINNIENEKFEAQFTPINPISEYFQCIADKTHLFPNDLKYDFLHAFDDEETNKRVLNYILRGGRSVEYFLRTSQAVDVINGGFKANALPENVNFLINSRIAVENTTEQTVAKFAAQAKEIAQKYNLSLTVEGEEYVSGGSGFMSINTLEGRNPAPISPHNEVWEHYAGVIRGFFEDVVFPGKYGKSESLVVSGSVMSANTDSKHYWNLTENIYRYQPGFYNQALFSTIHSINERIDAESMSYVVGFYYDYLHAVSQE